MSGPKVVHIVTREEILEICRGYLARVDAALEEWTRIGRHNNCVDKEAIDAATRRRSVLTALIATDRFMDLQKQAPMEEAFLRDDLQHRLRKVAEKQAAARSREQRGREVGASLLRILEQRGRVAPELAERLCRGDGSAFAEGFRLMSDRVSEPSASDDLAARLREDGSSRSYSSWLATRPEAPTDPVIERIECRIAEIAQSVGAARLDGMRARLSEAGCATAARRSLLLDGLDVETRRELERTRRHDALRLDLRLVVAEIKAAGIASDPHFAESTGLDSDVIERRIRDARQVLDAHRVNMAAASRRAAVLQGLAKLGYEVTEGMTTSLAEQGRIVLKSAARPDYGVEVASAGSRMQLRPVAFDSGGRGPDPARDQDAETIWCGDVSMLQAQLTKVGDGLTIEKALPVGAVPLKRIVVTDARDQSRSIDVPIASERTLPRE